MKIKYYFWCLFILLVIPFLAPTYVSAEESSIDASTKEEFVLAIQNKNSNIINITADMDLTGLGAIDVSEYTIDLNGHTISAINSTVYFEGVNFTIKNGNFDSLGGSYALFIGDSMESDNVLIENISTKGGINVFNSLNVVLKNVNVDVDLTNNAYYAIWCDANAHVTVESGNYTSNGVAVIGMSKNTTDLFIKGGNFVTNGNPLVLTVKENDVDKFNKPVISGGTFNAPISEYLAEDCDMIDNGDGTYSVNTKSDEVNNETVPTPSETTDQVYTPKYTVTYNANPVKVVPTSVVSTPKNVDTDIVVSDIDDKKEVIEVDIEATFDEDTAHLSWWWILLILFGVAGALGFIIILIKKRKNKRTNN